MVKSRSSISDWRKSNAHSVIESKGKRSSLLIHPHGIEVLKEYKKIKDDESKFNRDEQALVKELTDGLMKEDIIWKKESIISAATRSIIETHWKDGRATGEKQELVQGESQGTKLTGEPDVVLRLGMEVQADNVSVSGVDAKTDKGKEIEGGESKNAVANIFELAVDGNGGEKKHLQAYDYSRFILDKAETHLFFVMHVDRKQVGCMLAITLECFIYYHDEKEEDKKEEDEQEDERKYGFLWREYYFSKSENGAEKIVEKACQGIVRSIHCSTYLQTLPPHSGYWKTYHNNVAVMGSKADKKEWVYKIFDNRYLPTQRKPENWLQDNTPTPWAKDLQVEKYLVYEETPGMLQHLGKPMDPQAMIAKEDGQPSPRKKRRSSMDKVMEPMPYGTGSMIVIRYAYQHGSHAASKLSNLQDIVKNIHKMHEAGMVHGDIRGHNLLHPIGQGVGIKRSLLIDFDLSGKADQDRYPEGLSTVVPENLSNPRSIVGGKTMKKVDDWKEFGSAIGVYQARSGSVSHSDEFADVAYKYSKGQIDLENPTKLLDDLFEKYGDMPIQVHPHFREKYKETAKKGTGSPGGDPKPRGKMSGSLSASH